MATPLSPALVRVGALPGAEETAGSSSLNPSLLSPPSLSRPVHPLSPPPIQVTGCFTTLLNTLRGFSASFCARRPEAWSPTLSPWLIHSPATRTSALFRHLGALVSPEEGPLHVRFPLPAIPFPALSSPPAPSYPSGLSSHVTSSGKPSLTTPAKLFPTPARSRTSLCICLISVWPSSSFDYKLYT